MTLMEYLNAVNESKDKVTVSRSEILETQHRYIMTRAYRWVSNHPMYSRDKELHRRIARDAIDIWKVTAQKLGYPLWWIDHVVEEYEAMLGVMKY